MYLRFREKTDSVTSLLDGNFIQYRTLIGKNNGVLIKFRNSTDTKCFHHFLYKDTNCMTLLRCLKYGTANFKIIETANKTEFLKGFKVYK